MAQHLWIVGAIIVVAILVQTLLATFEMFRRMSLQQAQRRQTVALLDLHLDAARERRQHEKNTGPRWVGWRKFQVKRRAHEDRNKEVCSFYLEPHDGKSIAGFEPGQFLTFKLDTGEAKPIVRCYSLSDCANPKHYRVSIKRVPAPRGTDHPPGRSSSYFHDHVREGDILDVRAPGGQFFLDRAATTPVVLIGGGVGITPVLSMLNAIAENGGARDTWFFYGIRNGGEHAMKKHLQDIARAHEKIKLRICYSSPEPDDVEGRDYDHEGRVDVDLFKKVLPSNNYDYYLCGPPPMMDALTTDLEAWGVPGHKVHSEKFGPGAPRERKAAPADAGTGIEVSFKKAGKQAAWTPGQGTLLEFALANDVNIDSGCKCGDCGTCETVIRSGEIEYEKKPAFKYQAGTCLPCCCVPKGKLELDA